MVWRGSPSQTVNLPVYLLLGIGVVVSTAGLLFLRAGTAPSATTDVNLRSVYPWIIAGISPSSSHVWTRGAPASSSRRAAPSR